MNRQRPPKGIEWTRIRRADGSVLPGYTWNPTGGCLHGCTWQMPDGSLTECYAKTVAERIARPSYPHGFEHHYWRPGKLDEPLRLRDPAGIFVGSMADLFGHWVPREQIDQVLAVMAAAHWHTFQTLSKYPLRLRDFDFPPNLWVGVSLPAGHTMPAAGAARALAAYLRHMQHIQAGLRFLSIEPLWFDVAPVFARWLEENERLPFEWAIIGAASNGRRLFQPQPAWTEALLQLLDARRIPVFFKGNLAWPSMRADFPMAENRAPEVQPVHSI